MTSFWQQVPPKKKKGPLDNDWQKDIGSFIVAV
jgi:hypothetical protein